MPSKQKHVIRLERDTEDHLLPKDFYDVLMQRFLPILCLTFISSVFGIAAQKGDVVRFLFFDNTAYVMSLFIVFWISFPGILWIFLKGNVMLCYLADTWYKLIAGLQVLIITMSAVLFPEADIYGLKIYFVVTIPVLLLMYFFLVKGELPKSAAYPLNCIGLGLLLYGAVINVVFGMP